MEFCLPDLGEGIVEAELVEWLVKPGDHVHRGQNVAEVMTDKATVELPSPVEGTIEKLLVEPGQHVNVGTVLATFESSDVVATSNPLGSAQTNQPAPTVKTPQQVRHGNAIGTQRIVAAPSVRRMARQLGIDLTKVQGSGPGSRILINDVTAATKPGDRAATETSFSKAANGSGSVSSDQGEAPKSSVHRPGSRVPLVGLRRTIADRMVHATQTIPHFSYIDEVDLTEMVRLRESLREPMLARGIKLTYLSFVVKAAIAALKAVPQVNASLDADANEIILHDKYHIGIATDTPAGLMVPVVHHADKMDLPTLAAEIGRLTSAARQGKAKLDQLTGSTFTVTSTGGIGGLISTPIINEPAVGILGIGQVVQRPRFDSSGNVRAADVAYLSFSFDHRVVDGADGARFANVVIERLKNPAVLLLADE